MFRKSVTEKDFPSPAVLKDLGKLALKTPPFILGRQKHEKTWLELKYDHQISELNVHKFSSLLKRLFPQLK